MGASGWPISDWGPQATSAFARGLCRQEWLLAGEQVPAGSAGLRATSTRATLGRAACPADAGSPGSGRGSRVAGGVGGRLDQRPAQVVGAVVGQRAAMVTVAGLVDPWAQPGGAAPLLGRREPADVAHFGGDRVAQHPRDPRGRHQQRDIGWSGPRRRSSRSQPATRWSGSSMSCTVGGQRARPRCRHRQPVKQPAATGAEQVAGHTACRTPARWRAPGS